MIVGIDLGTTNSAIGFWREGQAQLIPNSLGSNLTPSAVSIDTNGEVLVGLAARERQITHPHLTATAFKRYMGSQRPTMLGGRTFLPEELSALVLRSLKADAERFLGEPVTDAVITVPAYFSDRQRKATKRAGQLAGLNVERLLNEPTAAALAYGIHLRDQETRFLVFDLGGGTFDVSVLELFEGIVEVRASTGDTQLGGEDFNGALVDLFIQTHSGKLGKVPKDDGSGLYQRIRDQAERCRRKLSTDERATMQVTWKERSFELEVSAEQFAQASQPLVERLRTPVLQALKDSNLPVADLNEVVLVGGATRMPVVRRAVTKMFGRFPATGVHPDEAVAVGAAIQAGLKARAADLKEVVLTDVCPYTLGVQTTERLPSGNFEHGIFTPILERNTTVPASRESVFSNVSDGQKVVVIEIYQGESRKVSSNIHLGSVEVPIPHARSGEIAVHCRFTYDINGILEVDVHVPKTGQKRQLVIIDDPNAFDSSELEKRRAVLAALKVHPRDEDANRALLARIERCYEQALGDKRALIGSWISQFNAILERQEPRQINEARATLSDSLDQLEGETYL